MLKLTRYTSIEELKASKNPVQPKQSESELESDLREFVTLLKDHSSAKKHTTPIQHSNHSERGK
jgi:hypothetical protein